VEYKIEMLADPSAIVGEGPVWDWRRERLLWTDIRTGRVFDYDPASGVNEQIHSGLFVGGLAVNRQGGFTFGTWEGVMLWRSDDDYAWLHHDTYEGERLQFNDCSTGPDGSFFGGTMYEDTRPGKLYRFFPDGTVDIVAEGLGTSNGMGFSPDLRTFYHTDTRTRTIYTYGHDPTTGEITNRREWVKVPDTEGGPDGMTVDAEGFIWSANWGSGCVMRFDPDGKEERRIDFPATQTSSAMFGGKDLNELYVTSAYSGTGNPPSGHEPPGYDFSANRGGQLYRVKVDVQGKREFETDFAWPA